MGTNVLRWVMTLGWAAVAGIYLTGLALPNAGTVWIGRTLIVVGLGTLAVSRMWSDRRREDAGHADADRVIGEVRAMVQEGRSEADAAALRAALEATTIAGYSAGLAAQMDVPPRPPNPRTAPDDEDGDDLDRRRRRRGGL